MFARFQHSAPYGTPNPLSRYQQAHPFTLSPAIPKSLCVPSTSELWELHCPLDLSLAALDDPHESFGSMYTYCSHADNLMYLRKRPHAWYNSPLPTLKDVPRHTFDNLRRCLHCQGQIAWKCCCPWCQTRSEAISCKL